MKLNLFFTISLVFLAGVLYAKEPLLSNDLASAIDDSTAKEAVIRSTTEDLYEELEDLKLRLKTTEDQNIKLKKAIEVYQNDESSRITKDNKISVLKSVISKDPFLTKDVEDMDYNFGYQAIILGNVNKAEEALLAFVAKDFSSYNIGETEEEQHNFLSNVSKLKDKAYYLIGSIKYINLEPKEALTYLATAYKNSVDSDIVLLSLLKLLEVFDMLDKKQEACLTIKRIYSAVVQIQEEDTSFTLDKQDIALIEQMQQKNECNFKIKNKKTNDDAISQENVSSQENGDNQMPLNMDEAEEQEVLDLPLEEKNENNSSNETSDEPAKNNLEGNENILQKDAPNVEQNPNVKALPMPKLEGSMNNNFIDN